MSVTEPIDNAGSRRPSRRGTRGLAGVALALGLTLACALPAAATATENPQGKLLGIVPAHGALARGTLASRATPIDPLTYHGGPVLHSNRTHVIYWQPSGFSFPSGYTTLIDGYLQNVAADSGKPTNVYATDSQYADGAGGATYSSGFAGSLLVTDALPANALPGGGGCSDPSSYATVCLTDADVEAELAHVIAANGLPTGLGDVYFLVLPQDVGSCGDAASGASDCAYTAYCAYHSAYGAAGGTTLYDVLPYAAVAPCDSGEHPNGSPADPLLNTLSHEHNETITDPLGNAWYDSQGWENGDKCAWGFGTPLGGAAGQQFNQAIGAGSYWLQQEWSNALGGCTSTNRGQPVAVLSANPTSAATGQWLGFNGTASHDNGATITTYAWSFGDGTTTSVAAPAHAYSRAGTYNVTLTVTDNTGVSAQASTTIVVTSPPSSAGSRPSKHERAPRVRIKSTRLHGRRVTVSGTVSGNIRAVTVIYTARVGGRTVRVQARAAVLHGRFHISLQLPAPVAQAHIASVAARPAGGGAATVRLLRH